MKHYLLILIAAALVAGLGCEPNRAKQQPQTDQKSAIDAKPLLLLDDEPLLLGSDQPDDSHQGPKADNSRCHVCHINYADEDIAVIHARANIGCNHCHGDCDAHIADESWAMGGNGTAPDTMYVKSKINPACMGCHPRDKIDTAEHEPFLGAAEDKVCTDCHGKHRLAERRFKWK